MTQWILTSSVLILLVLAVRGLFKSHMKAKAVYALWFFVLVRLLCPFNFGELSFNLVSLAEKGKDRIAERMQEEEQQELKQTEQSSKQNGEIVHDIFIQEDNTIVYYPPGVEKIEDMQTDEASSVISEMETNTVAENPEFKIGESVTIPEVKTEMPPAESKRVLFLEISWKKMLNIVWIIGMVIMAMVIFGVNISFSTTLKTIRKELPLSVKKGRRKRKISVYLAEGITSSCLYGVLHPSIYLNRDGMSKQEKNYCIEHEYSHYLQGDMVWSLCCVWCLILHWYNPLVWAAVVLSKKDAELACDERTIERLGEKERYSYGHTLVELAAGQSGVMQMFGMATLMVSNKKEVAERVKAITTKKQTKLITGILAAVLMVGISCFVFTGEVKAEQLPNNMKYWPFTFIDHAALECSEYNGWLIDLNGDGKKEQLHIDENNIFIDGKLQQLYKNDSRHSFWLLDIDTTDGMYEVLDNNGRMFVYNGKELCEVKGITGHCFVEGEGENQKISSKYLGTLHNFTRIDEHTISFEDCFFMECSFFANAHYTLDENHHLQVVPQEYDIRLRTEVNGVSWYNYEKNQYNSFKLYKDRDLNGSYIEAGDLVSGIKLLKSDCVEWAYVETATGRCGWLYFGEGCEMYFTSKPILPQTEAEISANTNYHHSEAADTRKYQIDLHHLVDELKHKRNEHHTTAKHKTTCHH